MVLLCPYRVSSTSFAILYPRHHTVGGDEAAYTRVVVAGVIVQQVRAVQPLPGVVEGGAVYRRAGRVEHQPPRVELLPLRLASVYGLHMGFSLTPMQWYNCTGRLAFSICGAQLLVKYKNVYPRSISVWRIDGLAHVEETSR